MKPTFTKAYGSSFVAKKADERMEIKLLPQMSPELIACMMQIIVLMEQCYYRGIPITPENVRRYQLLNYAN